MLISKKSHKTTPVPGAYKHMAGASSFLVHNKSMSTKPNFPTKSTTQVLYSAMSYGCNQFWQTIWWWSMQNLKQFQNSNPRMSCFWNLVPTYKKLAPIDKAMIQPKTSFYQSSVKYLITIPYTSKIPKTHNIHNILGMYPTTSSISSFRPLQTYSNPLLKTSLLVYTKLSA